MLVGGLCLCKFSKIIYKSEKNARHTFHRTVSQEAGAAR